MRLYEIRTPEPKPRKVLVRRECDLCHAVAKHPGERWSGSVFDVSETEVSVRVNLKEGETYPEGGFGTEINIDLCPKCFTTVLVPWLVSQGAKIPTEDWERG